MDLSMDGEGVDAPPAPDYDADPEEALDQGMVDRDTWRTWPFWAKIRLLRRLYTEGAGRPEQFIDDSMDWYLWLLLGGRGSGKSKAANEWGAEEALRLPRIRVAVVARTFSDARDTIFEGETGLLAVIPDAALRGGRREKAYNRSLGELYLANGSRFKGFSAEKANALRGPQHHRAIIDEASSWEDADEGNKLDTTISNLMLGLRLTAPDGSRVRAVCSTTPKPNELTRFLHDLAERKGQVRVLSTYSNLRNLDEVVADVIVGMYEGTEVAAQELEGRILDEAQGAAWTREMTEAARGRPAPPAGPDSKVVVGVDPAVSSKATSDETGLVAVSRLVAADGEHEVRVLRDASGKVGAGEFPVAVWALVTEVAADEVVVEVNQGYDFVVQSIVGWVEGQGGTVARRTRLDRSSVKSRARQSVEYVIELEGHSFVLKPVFQSLDKLTRAKTASAWWHRGRASHAAGLDKLEDQMTTFDGSGRKSPDRLDALTSAVAAVSVRRQARASGGASPLSLFGQSAPRPGPSGGYPLLGANR